MRLSTGVAILCLLTGCATQRVDGPRPADVADGATVAGLMAAPPAPAAALPPAGLLPQRTVRGAFRRTAGDGTTQRFPFTLAPEGDGWTLTIEGLRRTFYRLDDQGRLVVPREDDFVENARVTYDPAIVLLSPRGDPHLVGEAAMLVQTLDGEQTRDRGRVTYEVQPLAIEAVQTPAGRFRTQSLRIHRRIDLSLADVAVESVHAFAPGEGPVAEASEREIRALGVFSNRSSSTLERIE